MSDSLTRLVERTLGLGKVLQPIITPIFTDDMFVGNGISTEPTTEAKKSDLLTPTEFSQAHGIELSSKDITCLRTPPLSDCTTITSEPRFSNEFRVRRSGLGNRILDDNSVPSKSVRLASKQKVGGELSQQYSKVESKGKSFSNKNMDVISRADAIAETAKGRKRAEKPHTNTDTSKDDRASSIKAGDPLPINRGIKPPSEKRFFLSPSANSKTVRPDVFVTQKRIEQGKIDNHSDVSAMSSPSPTIKVTIGRIDVRAVRQEAPLPLRKSRRNPRLSLDDYLIRRDRGER